MRVLVLGAGGQLGTDVAAHWSAAGDEVVATTRAQVDAADRAAVLGAVTSLRPDVVVNCAAWTAVDACESEPERALVQNALAVRFIAEACDRAGSHLVHVSTDYVFDGTKPEAYHEWDRTNPLGSYGRSKLAGEHEALHLGPHSTVARTSWVCSEHGSNMVKTILRLLDNQPTLTFVDDQVGHPTFTADLAVGLRNAALHRLSGVVHVTNTGATSWFGFAQDVARAAGVDPDRIAPIATADLRPARPAVRPANSRLDNVVLRSSGLPLLDDYQVPLARVVGQLRR